MPSDSHEFVRVVAYIRPHMLEPVKAALVNVSSSGLSVSEAKGTGQNTDQPKWAQFENLVVSLPLRMRLEIVVPADTVEELIAEITHQCRTGEPGDGKIFLFPVNEVHRIRTGETGSSAL